MPQDCFFTTRQDENHILRICPLCLDCGQKHEKAFFWDGSVSGFGKYKIVCGDCQKVIHEPHDQEAT